MRIHFDLDPLAPFTFEVEGQRYRFAELRALAQRARLSTNIHEFVYKLPTGKHVYLTLVGDEDQTSALGIHRGWYVADLLNDQEAAFMIDAMAKFTALYR